MDLSNLKYEDNVKESKDSVGGGFSIKPSGIYLATVKVAYLEKSRNGATGLNVTFGLEDGTEYKETFWATNREGKTSYTDKEGAKHPLKGFEVANDLTSLITGSGLVDQATERKVVKIRNFEQKTDVPTEVDCLTALHGQQVQLGIVQEKSFKSEKQADGTYKETTETRDTNSVDKMFHKDTGKTVNEYRAKVETADFKIKWLERWDGKVKDKTAGKTPSGAVAGAPKAVSKPNSSLFA